MDDVPVRMSSPDASAPANAAAGYYSQDRSDLISWIAGSHARVLEVGCAEGQNGPILRELGAETLVGVEINRQAAEQARGTFDVVLNGPIEEVIEQLEGPFDLILCADVLEHLVDPWAVLRRLRLLAAPTGLLAVSVPNIRHYRALLRIAFGQGFEYSSYGTFDQGHLRFFTLRNVKEMLRGTGWIPTRRRAYHSGRAAQALGKIGLGQLDEWLAYQWYVVAQPGEAESSA